jgi:Zn-dependent membrane protease YugP
MLSYLLMLTSFVVVLVIYFTGSNISVLLLILSILLTINALLLVGIGVIGEYIGRIYELVQNKPKVNWIEIV